MAATKLNWLVGRTSSSIIPLLRRTQSNNGSAIFRQFLPFVQFSTTVVAHNNNIASLFEPDYHNSPVPNKYSFKVQYKNYDHLSLILESEKEKILVKIDDGRYTYVEVCISRGQQRIHFNLYPTSDEFEIMLEVADIWNVDGEHLKNFEEYLRSKGINFDMINMLYDRMGIKPKNDTRLLIKPIFERAVSYRNCLDKRNLTLIKKCQHEIIRIEVTSYQDVMDYYDDECQEHRKDWCCPSDEEKVACKKQESPEEVLLHVNNPCLRLKVHIYDEDMRAKNITFDVLAFADSPDKILIRRMTARSRRHLEGFENFLKIKGIEPDSLKYFFHLNATVPHTDYW